MKYLHLFVLATMLASISSPLLALADETMGEKASEAASDTKKAVRKGTRKVKDKTCEMVDGKMSCAGKKMKHKMENAVDEVKDKTNTDK